MALATSDYTVVLAAALASSNVGSAVAGILDTPVTSKNFTQAGFSSAPTDATTPAYIPVVQSGAGALPTLADFTIVSASDGGSGGVNGGGSLNFGAPMTGYVKLTLAPSAGDVVNASSPMQYTVSPNAYILLSSAAS